jgi:hypothetical protein
LYGRDRAIESNKPAVPKAFNDPASMSLDSWRKLFVTQRSQGT